MWNHKSNFKNKNNDAYYKPFYVELRRINKKITDCTIITLETFENITIWELEKKENEYIKNYKNDDLNFNKNRTKITNEEKKKEKKEYNKEYKEKNKDKINEKNKEYNEKNKDKINKKNIC